MTTTTVDIRETQPPLSELLRLALAGTEVLIVEGNTPLARLIAVTVPDKKRVAGLNSGAISVSEDFDEALPDEFWAGTA